MTEVIHWDAGRHGPLSEAAMRRVMEELGYGVTRYTYPPGCTFPAHNHGVDKLDGVLSGTFRMGMHGTFVDLTAGDMLAVPKGAVHTAEVVGDEPVVSLDGVRQ